VSRWTVSSLHFAVIMRTNSVEHNTQQLCQRLSLWNDYWVIFTQAVTRHRSPSALCVTMTMESNVENSGGPQTIKSGSAFKGLLYFQVGQNGGTEGSVPEHRGKWVVGRSAVALPIEVWGKIFETQLWNRVFSAFCKLKWSHLQCRQGCGIGPVIASLLIWAWQIS